MTKCYERLGVLACDLQKDHEGEHYDAWILDGIGHAFTINAQPEEGE